MVTLDRATADRLKALLAAEGSTLLDNPQRLRGLIADRVSGHRRERHALIAALAADVPQRLRSRPAEMLDDGFRADLSIGLQESAGLDASTADWAVSAWAVALGLAETIKVTAEAGPEVRSVTPAWYRRPRALAATGAAAVLSLFVMGGVMGDNADPSPPPEAPASHNGGRQEETRSPTPTEEPTPTPTPTPEADSLDALLAWVSPDARSSCEAAELDETWGTYAAAVECALGDADLYYLLYYSRDDMLMAFRGFGSRPDGRCPQDAPANDSWHFSDSRTVRGVLGCYHNALGRAVVAATLDYANVLNVVIGSDGDLASLVDAWHAMGQVSPGD